MARFKVGDYITEKDEFTPNYIYEIAKAGSGYYQVKPILPKDEPFRLTVSYTDTIFKLALGYEKTVAINKEEKEWLG